MDHEQEQLVLVPGTFRLGEALQERLGASKPAELQPLLPGRAVRFAGALRQGVQDERLGFPAEVGFIITDAFGRGMGHGPNDAGPPGVLASLPGVQAVELE